MRRCSSAGAVALIAACASFGAHETHDGLEQISYAPAKGKGSVIVVLSGALGTTARQDFSARLAREGYYVVLLDGRNFRAFQDTDKEKLNRVIRHAQQSPHAAPGRAAVVSFSFSGGGALTFAASMSDLVSVIVAYYPYTALIDDFDALVEETRVPILILAGEQDRFNNCCVIEKARAIDAAAKAHHKPVTLVTYPNAGHAFDPSGPAYRGEDEADAWKQTLAMLRKHHRP